MTALRDHLDHRLAPNFTVAEFACRGGDCCNYSAPINPDLVATLQSMRNRLSDKHGQAVPFVINSGYRCRRHNARVGGSARSLHTYGLAVDIRTPHLYLGDSGAFAEALKEAVKRLRPWGSIHGLFIYNTFVHIDFRGAIGFATPAHGDNRSNR